MQRRRRPWWHWALAGLVGLISLVGIGLVVWELPSLLYGDVTKASADARLQAASGFRTALVAGLAGLAALGSLAMATRTYRLTQQSQLTDRYTKAIEQLGSDKPDIRLGGIYALERIAEDSPRDHATVVEVLGAFIREHSELGEEGSHTASTTDVRAAAAVLARLPDRFPSSSRGNLRWANLVRADLRKANLRKADLAWAHLFAANLAGANLAGADMTGACLKAANLSDANLENAVLEGIEVSEGTDFNGANLVGANLAGTDLSEADLTAVSGLTREQLENTIFDPEYLPREL